MRSYQLVYFISLFSSLLTPSSSFLSSRSLVQTDQHSNNAMSSWLCCAKHGVLFFLCNSHAITCYISQPSSSLPPPSFFFLLIRGFPNAYVQWVDPFFSPPSYRHFAKRLSLNRKKCIKGNFLCWSNRAKRKDVPSYCCHGLVLSIPQRTLEQDQSKKITKRYKKSSQFNSPPVFLTPSPSSSIRTKRFLSSPQAKKKISRHIPRPVFHPRQVKNKHPY